MTFPAADRPDLLKNTATLLGDLERWRCGIEAALEYAKGTHNLDDVVSGVLRGDMHFFCTEKSFSIMELWEYPRMRVYGYFLAGGSLDDLIAHIPTMQAAARALGCRALEIRGRAGWAKALAKHGFSHSYTALACEV